MTQTAELPVPKTKDIPARLLGTAGGIVIAAAFVGRILTLVLSASTRHSQAWHISLLVILGMLLLGMVLAIAALVRQSFSQSRIRTVHGRHWSAFALVAIVHVLFTLVLWRPGIVPAIDVYTFQKDACANLLKGIDPFGSDHANIYDAHETASYYNPGLVVDGRIREGFQYPPLTLYWAMPGYLLGDLRISYIFAVIAAAGMLFAISPGNRGFGVACILLFSPLTFIMEYYCFTESLVYFLLCATIYGAIRKSWWLPIALGLFLASKQYNVLALPFIAYFLQPFEWKAFSKLACLSLTVAAVTILPFAIWNPWALWHDQILFHLMQPFRPDSLSFAVPFPWIVKVGPVFLLGFIFWALRARNRSLAMFPTAYGIILLLFFATSKQAFSNYYFLVGHAFLLSVVALPAATGNNLLSPNNLEQ